MLLLGQSVREDQLPGDRCHVHDDVVGEQQQRPVVGDELVEQPVRQCLDPGVIAVCPQLRGGLGPELEEGGAGLLCGEVDDGRAQLIHVRQREATKGRGVRDAVEGLLVVHTAKQLRGEGQHDLSEHVVTVQSGGEQAGGVRPGLGRIVVEDLVGHDQAGRDLDG